MAYFVCQECGRQPALQVSHRCQAVSGRGWEASQIHLMNMLTPCLCPRLHNCKGLHFTIIPTEMFMYFSQIQNTRHLVFLQLLLNCICFLSNHDVENLFCLFLKSWNYDAYFLSHRILIIHTTWKLKTHIFR